MLVPVPTPGLASAAFGLNIATAATLGLSAISCMLSVVVAPGWDSMACAGGLLRSLSHLQIVSWTGHMAAGMPTAVDIASSSASWASLAVLPIAWTNWSASSMSNALPYIKQQTMLAPPPPAVVSSTWGLLGVHTLHTVSFSPFSSLPPPLLPPPGTVRHSRPRHCFLLTSRRPCCPPQSSAVSQLLSAQLLPFSPVLTSLLSATSAPSTLSNASAWATLVPASIALQPGLLTLLIGSAPYTLSVDTNLTSPILDAWNAFFSALFIGGGAVMLALIIHAGEGA